MTIRFLLNWSHRPILPIINIYHRLYEGLEHILSTFSSLIMTCMFLVSVRNYEPCHIRFKYRFPDEEEGPHNAHATYSFMSNFEIRKHARSNYNGVTSPLQFDSRSLKVRDLGIHLQHSHRVGRQLQAAVKTDFFHGSNAVGTSCHVIYVEFWLFYPVQFWWLIKLSSFNRPLNLCIKNL